jgi:hypothetical protein
MNLEIYQQSKHRMHTHSPNKLKKFKQTSAFQKADGNGFLRHERSADGGIYSTTDHTLSLEVYCESQKRCGTMTLLLHDNACPHSAACTQALLKNFNWELVDHPPYSHELTTSNYHLFTYLKNCLRSEHFNNNEKFRHSNKTWLNLFDICIITPQHDKCLHPGGSKLTGTSITYIFPYIFFFSLLVLLAGHKRLCSK